jgi:hypothetical protein
MFKIYCLRKIVAQNTMRIVYLSLYQAIFQYGIIAWCGTYKNIIKPLTIQKNKIVCMCLDKNMLYRLTKLNSPISWRSTYQFTLQTMCHVYC